MNMAPQTETKLQELGGSRSAGETDIVLRGSSQSQKQLSGFAKAHTWALTF